jgi:hypothetical protein
MILHSSRANGRDEHGYAAHALTTRQPYRFLRPDPGGIHCTGQGNETCTTNVSIFAQ